MTIEAIKSELVNLKNKSYRETFFKGMLAGAIIVSGVALAVFISSHLLALGIALTVVGVFAFGHYLHEHWITNNFLTRALHALIPGTSSQKPESAHPEINN